MPVRDRWGTDPARNEREDPPVVPAGRRGVAPRRCTLTWGLCAEAALSTMRSWTGPRDAEVTGMALKKRATPKRWRSKEAKAIVVAVQRAGGQVERTASGHLKVIGPAGSAIVASAPQQRPRRWAGRPQHLGDDQEQDRAADMNARPGVAYRSSSSLSFWRLAATASRTRGTATRPSRRPGPRSSSSTEFVIRVPSGMASRA
jgi:hypothetical protein